MVIHLLLGLVLGLIRWRAGGIVGLIVVHGLFDLLAAETLTPVSVTTLGQLTQITVINRPAVLAGDLLLLALILYLWKVHPAISRPRP
jgi:membrane protease YdiL (CAAX protease family)